MALYLFVLCLVLLALAGIIAIASRNYVYLIAGAVLLASTVVAWSYFPPTPSLVLLVLAATGFLSALTGNYVAKSLRMPDSAWKSSLIVAVIGIAALILVTSWPPKQGIDLKGGVILIYEVDENLTRQSARRRQAAAGDEAANEEAEVGDVDMPGLIQALSRRINPGGVQEIVVRAYGDKQVEIIIPDVSSAEVERIKKLITTGGFLKFQIVANRRDHSHILSLADEADQAGQYEVRDANGQVVGQWARLSIEPGTEGASPVYRVDPPGGKTRTVRGRKEVLMVVDPNFNLQGSHLSSVRKGYQDVTPAVFFETTVTGAALMGGLTESNLPDPQSGHYSLLGIVMDGELISAPRINSTITSSGVIEGSFTDEEVDLLVNVLRAGRLPAVLRSEPISQNEISPLLGSDTIRQGRIAIGVSLVAVLVFMLVYYRFAGFVACLALMLNLTLILALMIFVGAAFSLPGMAALVLTVGMSVDASVLIYERIREELLHGAALRMAIRNGFGRATRTIVDANLTTLITAVVLYLIGTEQLRAFAVALILGILMTLFSAIFFSRVVFELVEKVGRLKTLTMMQMFAVTHWDLFEKRRIAGACSLLAILVGVGAVSIRQNKIFDIDFLGGTSVQFLLKEPMPVKEVRQRVDQLRADGIAQDVAVTEVKSQDYGDERIYRVDTSLPNLDSNQASSEEIGSAITRVQAALVEEFSDAEGRLLLQTHSLSFQTPVAIAQAPGVTPPPSDLPSLNSPPDEARGGADDASDQDASSESGAATGGDDATSSETDSDPSASEDASTSNQGAAGNRPSDTLLAFASESLVAQAALGQAEFEPASTSPASGSPANASTDASSSAFDSSSLRSQSDLSFDEPINAETLEEMIKEAARKLRVVEPDVLLGDENGEERSAKEYQKTWSVKLSSGPEVAGQILGSLKATFDSTPVWLAANQIGGSVAGDKTRMAIAAVLGSLIGIIAYIWLRFQHVMYGLAAVIALVHDVLITLGAIALSYWLKDFLGFLQIDEFKISLPVVAAFLTIIGYSLNDTIVVFDRIREVKGKSPHLTSKMVNESINQTLSRTILTSLTTLIAVLILYAIGGQGIHAFAFALMVGIIVGTYSSIFIAAPTLLWMSTSGEAKNAKPEKVTA